jgi:hypothetical protein
VCPASRPCPVPNAPPTAAIDQLLLAWYPTLLEWPVHANTISTRRVPKHQPPPPKQHLPPPKHQMPPPNIKRHSQSRHCHPLSTINHCYSTRYLPQSTKHQQLNSHSHHTKYHPLSTEYNIPSRALHTTPTAPLITPAQSSVTQSTGNVMEMNAPFLSTKCGEQATGLPQQPLWHQPWSPPLSSSPERKTANCS